MNELLTKQLEQITKIISNLKGEDTDLEKLLEISHSLDFLRHQIKTVHLDSLPQEKVLANHEIYQHGVIYYNTQFEIIRFIGASNLIFGNNENNEYPEIKSLFTHSGYENFTRKTNQLIKLEEPQFFHSEIISRNEILLPVKFILEKIKIGYNNELFAAGMVFLNQTPSELESYRDILIENIPGIDLFLFDPGYRYILAGGREKARIGLSNADFIGKTLFEVFNEKTVKRLFPFYRSALDGNKSEGEVRIKGRVFLIQATPVFGIHNQIIGGALISKDVTTEKEIELNLLRAKKEAEESNRAKSVFLANMSHEIRTPLNAIVGFSDLLKKTNLNAEQFKYAQLISQSSEHLLSVVNEILFLFKFGMGKVYIEKEPFNIHELLKNVYESLLFMAVEKKLTFRTEIGKNVADIMIGDPFRVKQILMNLAGNAINYTEKGNVSIHVFREKLTRKEIFLRFDVTDTGIGIPKEDLNYIFEEFTQSRLTDSKNNKGVGLGLTIVKKLVDLLNGRIYVESKMGEGSKFTVVLPFERPHLKENPIPAKKYELTLNLLKGKRALYADDDQNNILLGESILKKWKIDYDIAYNGGEAITLLRNKKFDIALLDIRMPILKGTEVVQCVRNEKDNPNAQTKMLAVTANVMDSDIRNYFKSGFDGFILKPFNEEILYNKICNILQLENELGKEKSESTKKENYHGTFDTNMLLKTTAGNSDFFNKMIDTFIVNAKDTSESFKQLEQFEKWIEIGEKAHKAIPSFSYFGLTHIVDNLTLLENLALREKKYDTIRQLALDTSDEIEKIMVMAYNAKIED